jgi:hypothetical protein
MPGHLGRFQRPGGMTGSSIHVSATAIGLCFSAFVATEATASNDTKGKTQLPLQLLSRLDALCGTVEFLAVGPEGAAHLLGGHIQTAKLASWCCLSASSEVHRCPAVAAP